MYARFARWVGDKPWFRPLARRALPPVDKQLVKVGLHATPWPTLNLTTIGCATGKPRTVPLYFVEHGDDLAVIASNYGRAEPQWSRNLRRDRACKVLLRRNTTSAIARLATPEEWHDLFDRFTDFYPPYQQYLERAHRLIPIWVLSRSDAGG